MEEFSEPVQKIIRQIWQSLPAEQHQALQELLDQLPNSFNSLQDLFFFILDQYEPVLGAKQRIAILGPANVGKSTLHNQLVSRQEDEAKVGPVPGTTRQNQETDTGLFILIDTPGADAVGKVGQRERQIAFKAAQSADFLVIVFEATQGIKRYEKALFDDLLALNKDDIPDYRDGGHQRYECGPPYPGYCQV